MDKNIRDEMLYLKTNELQQICQSFTIPYNIYYKQKNKLLKSSHVEPKLYLINRIEKYLKHKIIDPESVIPEQLVKFESIPNSLSKADYIYFGQYKNGSKVIIDLMSSLTSNRFKFGSISCALIREYFIKGELITYEKFAIDYLHDLTKSIDHPEWQYINFDGDNWHEVREQMKQNVFAKLNVIVK